MLHPKSKVPKHC